MSHSQTSTILFSQTANIELVSIWYFSHCFSYKNSVFTYSLSFLLKKLLNILSILFCFVSPGYRIFKNLLIVWFEVMKIFSNLDKLHIKICLPYRFLLFSFWLQAFQKAFICFESTIFSVSKKSNMIWLICII